MSLKGNLRTTLIANPTVFSLVGNRIWNVRSPQNPGVPFIVMSIPDGVDDEFVETMDEGYTGERFTDVYFNCLATDADKAEAISLAVLNALKDFKGVADGHNVRDVRPRIDVDETFQLDDELFRRILVLRVMHKSQ